MKLKEREEIHFEPTPKWVKHILLGLVQAKTGEKKDQPAILMVWWLRQGSIPVFKDTPFGGDNEKKPSIQVMLT